MFFTVRFENTETNKVISKEFASLFSGREFALELIEVLSENEGNNFYLKAEFEVTYKVEFEKYKIELF
jgi:hypothetical protein